MNIDAQNDNQTGITQDRCALKMKPRKRRPFKDTIAESTRRARENKTTFSFGKYKGMKVDLIALIDPMYLMWIVENEENFSVEYRNFMESKLAKCYPECAEEI